MEMEKQAEAQDDTSALPLQHVAIIMDGNRRWAGHRRLPAFQGHQQGVRALKQLVRHAGAIRLNYLTVYAFSSENWSRSHTEVSYLLDLFMKVLDTELDELAANNVCLRVIGDLSGFPEELAARVQAAMARTAANTGLCLQVALNYGSRAEIAEAARRIAFDVRDGKLEPESVDADTVSAYLYTAGIPDPDLLIRTGGEMRLSNYLLWQSAYAELYVTPVLWPDFTPAELDHAVAEFRKRARRYGGD